MSLRPNDRTEVRRNRYKVAVDADEGRRRREDNMVEIRKNKREESLQKKRREGLQSQQQFPTPYQGSTVDKKVQIRAWSCSVDLRFCCFDVWSRGSIVDCYSIVFDRVFGFQCDG